VSEPLMLRDEAATRRLGAALARHCPWSMPGARCVFLSGELGAGKTTLISALLAACGVRETVRSPTYSLIEVYAFDARVGVHLDLYRLHGAGELEQLGLRDYLHDGALLLVEWPEQGRAQLPRPDLWLQLWAQEPGRRCRLTAHSAAGECWLAELPGESLRSEGA
jgi:tRNA threonylcarbamoyladenosine biosynthesis protein TsaE